MYKYVIKRAFTKKALCFIFFRFFVRGEDEHLPALLLLPRTFRTENDNAVMTNNVVLARARVCV